MRWRFAFGGLVAVLAGCADVPPAPPAPPPAAILAPPAVEPPKLEDEVKIRSQPLKYLVGRQLTPQPTRPLNVRSRCSHRDAVGTRTALDLLVKEAAVKTFTADIAIKGHGTCRFRLKDFEQAEKLPQALLKSKDGSGCSVRLWEEGARVTVAFNSCPQSCEGDAFSYLWPILIEAKSGRCF